LTGQAFKIRFIAVLSRHFVAVLVTLASKFAPLFYLATFLQRFGFLCRFFLELLTGTGQMDGDELQTINRWSEICGP